MCVQHVILFDWDHIALYDSTALNAHGPDKDLMRLCIHDEGPDALERA